MAGTQPAGFISIPDLLASSIPNEKGLVRVIGRLENHDVNHSMVWIQDYQTPSFQMAVATANIEPFPSRVGTLYQFIGEVNYREIPTQERCLVLSALVYRNMDGLDMDIYMKSHEARMKDLSTPFPLASFSS